MAKIIKLVFWVVCPFVFEARSHSVAQASLQLRVISLPQFLDARITGVNHQAEKIQNSDTALFSLEYKVSPWVYAWWKGLSIWGNSWDLTSGLMTWWVPNPIALSEGRGSRSVVGVHLDLTPPAFLTSAFYLS